MEVRAFGLLRTYLKKDMIEIDPPKEIKNGKELASHLGLPLDLIECLMVDGKAEDLDSDILGAQRLAFIPYGTPGPYRVFLGLKRECRHGQID